MNRLAFSLVATGAIFLFITLLTPRIVTAVVAKQSFPGWPKIDAIIECGNIDDYLRHTENIKAKAPWINKVFILANPITTKAILEINRNALVFSNSYEIIHGSNISDYFLYFRENSSLESSMKQEDYLYYIDVKLPYGIVQYTFKNENVIKDPTITELFEEHPNLSIDTGKPQMHFKENYKILFEKMVSEKIRPETIEIYTHLTSETVKKV